MHTRLSPRGAASLRRAVKRLWSEDGALRKKQRERARHADAETLRKLALETRRGKDYATITFRGQKFVLLWSVTGRTDQVDIFHAGGIIAAIRPSAAIATIEKFIYENQI